MERSPKVGVGVIVLRDGKVLMHKRKGAHGEGTWSFPGGHLEFNETWQECAAREVLEETGMRVLDSAFVAVTNDFHQREDKHYITIFMLAQADGEPRIMEPEKCEYWEWFSWDALPEPLFLPVANLVKQGYRP